MKELLGSASLVPARQDPAPPGLAPLGMASRVEEGNGKARHDSTGRGVAGFGLAPLGMSCPAFAGLGSSRPGSTRLGSPPHLGAWPYSVRRGSACRRWAWLGESSVIKSRVDGSWPVSARRGRQVKAPLSWHVGSRRGESSRGETRLGMSLHRRVGMSPLAKTSSAWQHGSRLVPAGPGGSRHGFAPLCLSRPGTASPGQAWIGSSSLGMASLSRPGRVSASHRRTGRVSAQTGLGQARLPNHIASGGN